MIRIYEDVAMGLAAMPVIAGRKSQLESFAGANDTYTIEGMMGDKRALQVTPSLAVRVWDSGKARRFVWAITGICNV